MFDLAPYNTFGLHVFAKDLRIIKDPSTLNDFHSCQYLILGHGSDVLFTSDYDGTILVNAIKGIEFYDDGDSFVIKIGGGEILDDVILYLLQHGIVGLENLSKIPGTVGAAPIQNVGAYGVEIGDFVDKIETYNIKTKEIVFFNKDECQFDYRSSVFKTEHLSHLFITNVYLRIKKDYEPILSYKDLKDAELKDAFAIRNKVIELRDRKLPDPRYVGNAGSFFKNPIVNDDELARLRSIFPNIPTFVHGSKFKVAAGFLIEKAGLRGITHGNAGTWEHQSLVLVNRGNAMPHEIVALAKYIVARVNDLYGVLLEPEVRIFGKNGELSWQEI